MTYPRNFSHIGITVTDLDKAVEFYTKVMGWYLIMPATTISEDDSAIGVMCNDVFGPGWGSFRIAHLSTGDKIGIELFEFPNSEQRENNFEFWKTGVFHFSVQDPDVEGLAARIVAAGGKQRMPVREYYPGEKPYRMVYMEDPFGNIVEIYSHIDGRPGLPSPQSMKVSQVEIAAIDPDFTEATASIPDGIR